MRRRRTNTETPEPNAGFDWREVVCDSESAAKSEAERQQSLDDDEVAEWICLKATRRASGSRDGRRATLSPKVAAGNP
jgi:hypothetical protein